MAYSKEASLTGFPIKNVTERVRSIIHGGAEVTRKVAKPFREIVKKFGVGTALLVLLGAYAIYAPGSMASVAEQPKPPFSPSIPPGKYPVTGNGGWEMPMGSGETPVYINNLGEYVQTDQPGWIDVPKGYAPFVKFCVSSCDVPPHP